MLIELDGRGLARPALGARRGRRRHRDRGAGRVPRAWRPKATTTTEEATFLAPLDPVSARKRAKPLFDFDYIWEVYTPAPKRKFGYYALPVLWGDRLVARFDGRLDRATRPSRSSGCGWRTRRSPATRRSSRRSPAGSSGCRRFLGAERLDAGGVPEPAIRRDAWRATRT